MNETKELPRRRGIQIFKIGGIQITLDFSWFIIFFLVLWALVYGYFPFNFPGYPRASYWAAGLVSALLLFFSILAHELMHSFVAIRSGISIPEITLFIFGGVSRISEEAKTPPMEIKIALAGPLCSFALALVFYLARMWIQTAHGALATAVFGYLAWINVALGAFNLVPGFPMDGGRVFRAIWWWRTGSLVQATRVASDMGKAFAWALILIGGIQIFTGGLIGGLWLIFIGMFLRGVAEQGFQELIIRQSLEGVHVREVMTHDVVSVPPDLPVSRLINDYFIKFCFRTFPVVQEGKVSGMVDLTDVKNIPEEERNRITTKQVMQPVSPEISIAPDASLADALRKMTVESLGKLIVIQGDQMIGLITKAGLLRFLEVRQILHVRKAAS
jgi:Zn-dependent protease